MLEELLTTMRNLRMCATEVEYINKAERLLVEFDFDTAQDFISNIVTIYNVDFNTISKHLHDRPVTQSSKAQTYYEQATDDDVYTDLEYVRLCLITISAFKCGLLHNLDEVIDELKM